MRYFEDMTVGAERVAPGEYLVREEEIMEMGRRWDPQPFHTDPEAAKESFFGGLVASSVHLFGIAVHLGSTYEEKTAAVTALGFKELQWHAPARPGDVLKLRSKLLTARGSNSRPECGVVESRSEIFNQRDEIVFTYQSAALISRRSAPAP